MKSLLIVTAFCILFPQGFIPFPCFKAPCTAGRYCSPVVTECNPPPGYGQHYGDHSYRITIDPERLYGAIQEMLHQG